MAEDIFFISPPVECGRRKFFPLVRVFHLSSQSSFIFSLTVIAVIIEEEGEWSFIAIEEGVREEIIREAVPIRRIRRT